MMAPGRILLLGGTSEIGVAIVRELAARGGASDVVLAGRDPQRLRETARGLQADGCGRVQTLLLSARDRPGEPGEPAVANPGLTAARGERPPGAAEIPAIDGHGETVRRARELLGGVDLVVVAVGALGERGGLPVDVDGAVQVLDVNVVLAGSLLLHSARELYAQGHGRIVVLSSVAAQRPRASNAVYCAAKAGLDALARGLDDALQGSGVRVTLVRPGFVTTRMTAGLRVPPLACDAASVARATARGLECETPIVWAPGGLRWLMVVLGLLPRSLFRRLPL